MARMETPSGNRTPQPSLFRHRSVEPGGNPRLDDRGAVRRGCRGACRASGPGAGGARDRGTAARPPRMQAGAEQRVALTLLSSLVMIRLGRVYEGLMVDVQPSNRKLVRRSEAILGQLTGHSREHVRDALRQAKGSVKLALLLLEGRGLDEARGALDEAGGDLRAAKTLLEGRRTQKKRA